MAEHDSDGVAADLLMAAARFAFPNSATRLDAARDISRLMLGEESERAELNNQIDRVVRKLEKRLRKAASTPEFRNLDSAEREVALSIVSTVAQSLVASDFVEVNRDVGRLYQLIAQRAYLDAPQHGLSDIAQRFGHFYVRLLAAYSVQIARTLSEVSDEATWRIMATTQQTLEKVIESACDTVILAQYRSGTPDEHAEFEARYSTWILDRYGTMEIFGLDVPSVLKQQRADIAYVQLTVESEEAETNLITAGFDQEAVSTTTRSRTSDSRQTRTLTVPGAIGSVLLAAHASTEVRTNRGRRFLVSGAGGSGKTTVTHWIACTAITRTFDQSMASWNGATPFVVPMREAFKSGSVTPGTDALLPAGLRGQAPGDWLHQVLSYGQAIVIFDGFDEVARNQLVDARKWIEELIGRYPECRFIVTSRPETEAEPAKVDGMVRLALEPLSREGVVECIHRWFAASIEATPKAKWESLVSAKQRLLDHVGMPGGVRDLAETPLICAMLCALYSSSTTAEATTRAGLYEKVILTLAHEREDARGTIPPVFQSLTAEHKMTVLQTIAFAMTTANSTRLAVVPDDTTPAKRARLAKTLGLAESSDNTPAPPQPTVLGSVRSALASMPTLRADPKPLSIYLVERAVVLSEVADNEIEFRHRSIQEYLTGRHVAAHEEAKTLATPVERSESAPRGGVSLRFGNGSTSILPFACAHASKKDSSALIDNLLRAAADTSGPARRRLLILAAECTASAPAIEESTADAIRHALEEVFPPRSLNEATSIASFGEPGVPWLSERFAESYETQRACVHALAQIGGSSALLALGQYARLGDRRLRTDLLDCWGSFEPATYLREVVQDFDLTGHSVAASSMRMFEALTRMDAPPVVKAEMHDGPTDLSIVSGISNPIALDCSRYYRLKSVANAQSAYVRRLNLSGAQTLQSLEGLSGLRGLRELYVEDCPSLRNIDDIREAADLVVLTLNNCPNIDSFDGIGELTRLRTLSLDGCSPHEFEFLNELRGLSRLGLRVKAPANRKLNLENLGKIQRLSVRLPALADGAADFISPPNIEDLEIIGGSATRLNSSAGRASLRRLAVRGAVGEISLARLAESFPNLIQLTVDGCIVDNSGPATSHPLFLIELIDCSMDAVDGVAGFESLRRVVLDGSSSIMSVDPLMRCRSLSSVSLLDVHAPIHRLLDAFDGNLEIEHLPWDSTDGD